MSSITELELSDRSSTLSPPLSPPDPPQARHFHDVFWLLLFLLHLVALTAALGLLGVNRFTRPDRFNIDRFNITAAFNQTVPPDRPADLTETFWPVYGVAGGVGAVLAFVWLAVLGARAALMMRVSVHILTTYLAVISVFCFWGDHFLWGVAFAVGAGLHFLYVMSVMDRFPFTMLVLQKAVTMVCDLPEVKRVAYIFLILILIWMALWSFGVAGVVALSMDDNARWWLLVIRGVRSKIGNNECLLCCIDFLFHLVETLVRFFNKYAYVQIAVNGKSFNRSARDAWELFQSTGIEALIAYDCSGAVLLMTTIFGGLITGTCAGVWTWYKRKDEVIMVGSTSILMGMILMGLAVVVVESAVTSIYICFAEDPSLIQRWDAEFYNQMSEVLHQRLQYRSARARQVMDGRFDQIPDPPSI